MKPALLLEALRTIRGSAPSLPFVEPVTTNDALARTIDNAFRVGFDGIALDELVLECPLRVRRDRIGLRGGP